MKRHELNIAKISIEEILKDFIKNEDLATIYLESNGKRLVEQIEDRLKNNKDENDCN